MGVVGYGLVPGAFASFELFTIYVLVGYLGLLWLCIPPFGGL